MINLDDTKEFEASLYNYLENKDDIVIVNIGTDKVIGDSVAPLLGTFLKNYSLNWSVYGTLDDPIHAVNLNEKLKIIHKTHPNAFIIGIDACLGNKKDIVPISLRESPVRPGKGVGKDLTEVGDISILARVEEADSETPLTQMPIRLNLIYNMAKQIEQELLKIHNKLYNHKIAV
jgi:putative sporulation protein YyaC